MRSNRTLWTRVIALTLSSCLATRAACPARGAENELTVAERKSGWKLLFDGKTTKGWRGYRKESIGEGWTVQDGALVRAAGGAGDIVAVDAFERFELSIEFRISEGGNSGIMFRVTEDADAPWHSGPEIQIQDNVRGRDPQKAGWLYQLYRPPVDPRTGQTTDACRPAGEWNHVYVRITDSECEINVNGVRYAAFEIGSDDWNRRVAASKFARFANFAKADKGLICLQDHGDPVAFRNIKARELAPDGSVPDPVDGVVKVRAVPAFPKIEWEDWAPADERGRPRAFRPVVVTHANDASGRLFIADQHGAIYALANEPSAERGGRFLDIRDRVRYLDSENEEGLLGVAFHPEFARDGRVFVYYSAKDPPHTSVISSFRVADGKPDRADPASEQVLLKIEQPFWNHNGGTVAFGPDGYLYIGLGDGGAANDPFGNGQNLKTLLGSILRIDVNAAEGDRPYGIPADNPFLGRPESRPEIYAFGLRNVWRLAFDRETGDLWCGDVGQNLWEEINLIRKGGNYGWAFREGTHAFGAAAPSPDVKLIEPIWEYDHQVGKSITGGTVYRGRRCPQLVGKYVYADYVTGRIWALTADPKTGHVIRNESIPSEKLPILSFGEDAEGEVYFTVVTSDARGVFTFVPDE